jgi:hypothetical protein
MQPLPQTTRPDEPVGKLVRGTPVVKHLALSYDAAWHGLLFTGMGVGLLLFAAVVVGWAAVVGVVSLFKKESR